VQDFPARLSGRPLEVECLVGKPGRGWRKLAVLISHFTHTPRPMVNRYTLREALRERDAIADVMAQLKGTP
jgi:hypothetical protein